MHAILGVAVAYGRMKDGIAFLDPCFHLLDHLPSVLLTFQLALGREDRLDEFALGRIVELEVQALDPRAALLKLAPQLDVKLGIAGKALEVVEDDDVILVRLRIEIAEKRDHARALDEIPAA